jgi:hypothetical protein
MVCISEKKITGKESAKKKERKYRRNRLYMYKERLD